MELMRRPTCNLISILRVNKFGFGVRVLGVMCVSLLMYTRTHARIIDLLVYNP